MLATTLGLVRMTPHDKQLFWRTLGLSTIALGAVLGVAAATDEAYSTTPMRVARLCALSPLVAALALAVTTRQAERRGELRALAGLGASPWSAAWGGLCAAWLFGVVASLLLLTSVSDVSSLFPEPPLMSGWLIKGSGFWEPSHGLVVTPDGTLSFVNQAHMPEPYPKPGGLEAASTILPQAIVLPPWLLAPLGTRPRVWGFGFTLALTLLALHAAALGRLAQVLLPLVALPIGAQLAFVLERSRNQVALFSSMLGGARSKRYS